MQPDPIKELHEQITNGIVPTGNSEVAVQVRIGVEFDPEEEIKPFSPVLSVLESVDFITYQDIHDAFHNEEKFFALNPVFQINGANERHVHVGDAGDGRTAVSISLGGSISPDVIYNFYTQVEAAGHHAEPIRQFGIGANRWVVFTILVKS